MNPVLAAGEIGHETDTGKEKKGDGAKPWNLLPYTDRSISPLSTAAGLNGAMTQWGSSRIFCGYDATTGYYYFYNSSGFYRSLTPTSSMTSITLPGGAIYSGNRITVRRFGSYLYCLVVTSSNGSTAPALYQSDPTTISWTKVLDLGTHTDILWTGIDADASYIYVTEYSSSAQGESANGGPDNGVRIYRSAIGSGTTWNVQITIPKLSGGGIRHAHAIACDPYRPGHVYLTVGDAGSDRKVMRSTDYGVNWTTIVGSTQAGFQAVQISFSPTWVWFAADSVTLGGLTVWVMDRDDLTPRWATLDYHRMIAVPGGAQSRKITDASFTSGSGTMTSATASFTSADVGRFIYDTQNVNDGTYIASVTDSSTVVLSQAALNTLSSQSLTIGGDEWYGGAYYGAVDPATERYFCVAMDSTVGGTVCGLFVLDRVGGQLRLMKRLHFKADCMLYIIGGYIYVHRFQVPLPG